MLCNSPLYLAVLSGSSRHGAVVCLSECCHEDQPGEWTLLQVHTQPLRIVGGKYHNFSHCDLNKIVYIWRILIQWPGMRKESAKNV